MVATPTPLWRTMGECIMPTYQHAYRLGDIRRFTGWKESTALPAEDATDEARGPLEDDTVVFLHEDLRVTASCFADSKVLFDEVTDAWRLFCRETLQFVVPDWKAESELLQKVGKRAGYSSAALVSDGTSLPRLAE